MKRSTCLFTIALFMVAGSCKKAAVDPAHPLIGKWRVIANFISPGGPGTWINVAKGTNTFVQFNADGSIKGNEFPQYTTYAYKDTTTLLLTGPTVNPENYFYKISHDTLTMGPAGPIFWIEGCGTRFIRE